MVQARTRIMNPLQAVASGGAHRISILSLIEQRPFPAQLGVRHLHGTYNFSN